MTDRMRAVVKKEPKRGVAIERVPVPKPGPGEVLVRVVAASICGTDLHIYDWNGWAAQAVKPPLIIGHEVTGEIVEAGPGVKRLRPGDHISAESHFVCGKCLPCRRDQKHVCANTKILGVDVPGTFAEFVLIPESSAWPHRRPLAPELGTILEPLGNAVHCAQAGEVAEQRVAVFGCGPAGLFAVAACRALGAKQVMGIDLQAGRLELARTMGANPLFRADDPDLPAKLREATDRDGVDVALEMSGAPDAFRTALAALRNGGALVAFGIGGKPFEIDMTTAVILKGVRVLGVVGRQIWRTWELMQDLLDSGKLDPRPAITHRYSLAEFEHAVARIRSKEEVVGKIILIP